MDQIKYCQCGSKGELKQFNSFSYFYCGQCKDEISEARKGDTLETSNSSEPRFAGEMTFEQWQSELEDLYAGSSDFSVVTSHNRDYSVVYHRMCCATALINQPRKWVLGCGKEFKL